jgi:AraC-like DNA-binding protein
MLDHISQPLDDICFGSTIVPDARHRRGVEAPAPDIQSLRCQHFLLTRTRCETGFRDMQMPASETEGFIVVIQLRALAVHELWLQNELVHRGRYPERGVCVFDLDDEPRFRCAGPFDSLQFYVKRAALDALADEHGDRRIDVLSWPHGTLDETLSHLGSALLPALENPQPASRLFLDHMGKALIAHFACAYGGMRVDRRLSRGGLAPWQERRCKEIVEASIAGEISLEHLANECRLSERHFARAFRKSVGETPHRWILRRRVEVAKAMLAGSEKSIPDVAIACGFADQSHLTRVFSGIVGVPPGAWRRACRKDGATLPV